MALVIGSGITFGSGISFNPPIVPTTVSVDFLVVGGGGGGSDTAGGGGGAGGASNADNRVGGSGIVILRYADSNPAATSTTGSPTITVAGGYRVYKFTSSGSITF